MGWGLPSPEGRDGQGAARGSVGVWRAGKELSAVPDSSCWAGVHECLMGLLLCVSLRRALTPLLRAQCGPWA